MEGTTFLPMEVEKALQDALNPAEQKLVGSVRFKQRPLVVISGPTACGKTDLSLLVAKGLGGEIVSADSMQVYRGMDIGTAKASAEQQHVVPHHLIDIRDVQEPFTAADFFYEARKACDSILARNRVPVVVGGAGFYLRSFLYGPPEGPPPNQDLRDQLEEEAEALGVEVLYQRLKFQDSKYAETITPHDRQKIIRGLEIIAQTGGKVSDLVWKQRKMIPEYRHHCWFLHRPRDILYQRIEQRCEDMIEQGLVEEVEKLLEDGLKGNPSAAQAIGYRQAIKYLESDRTPRDYECFVQEFKRASRRYAKSQFTWFKQESAFQWLDIDIHDIEIAADIIIQEFQAAI
ncbi:MAG: tRNA (adenosine(37)-N6)-dimethylallyltransferase MiaA [Chlamydiota bacterium]